MGQPGAFTSFFGPDPLNLLGVVILTSLGTWGLPQMVGKFCRRIKGDQDRQQYEEHDQRLHDAHLLLLAHVPHMLSTLPDILIGIVVVLVLSASMSTLASLVLTSSPWRSLLH